MIQVERRYCLRCGAPIHDPREDCCVKCIETFKKRSGSYYWSDKK